MSFHDRTQTAVHLCPEKCPNQFVRCIYVLTMTVCGFSYCLQSVNDAIHISNLCWCWLESLRTWDNLVTQTQDCLGRNVLISSHIFLRSMWSSKDHINCKSIEFTVDRFHNFKLIISVKDIPGTRLMEAMRCTSTIWDYMFGCVSHQLFEGFENQIMKI